MINESLAAKLRALRGRAGLTLEDAAKRAGVDRGNLGRLEKGAQSPYMPTLSKLARGYGIDVEDLLVLVGDVAGKEEAFRASKAVPETLAGVLELRGAETKHLADENLFERLNNASVDGVIEIAREVFREVEAIGPFLSEELDKVPRFSPEWQRVAKIRGSAYERHLAVRLQLAEKVGVTWSYAVDEDVERVQREGLEAEQQLLEVK